MSDKPKVRVIADIFVQNEVEVDIQQYPNGLLGICFNGESPVLWLEDETALNLRDALLLALPIETPAQCDTAPDPLQWQTAPLGFILAKHGVVVAGYIRRIDGLFWVNKFTPSGGKIPSAVVVDEATARRLCVEIANA